eukprot:scaffold21446_cov22-Tisochrysis_lutea.AAC.4
MYTYVPTCMCEQVTAGIVSCVERRGHELGLPGCRSAYIQTDVAINQVNWLKHVPSCCAEYVLYVSNTQGRCRVR